MVFWVVKGGQSGELDREPCNLANNAATLGWAQLGDLSGLASQDAAERVIRAALPDEPLKAQPVVTFGDVTSAYRYGPSTLTDRRIGPHRIGVRQWISLTESDLDEDLLRSLQGGRQQVFQLRRHDLEGTIRNDFLGSFGRPTAAAEPS